MKLGWIVIHCRGMCIIIAKSKLVRFKYNINSVISYTYSSRQQFLLTVLSLIIKFYSSLNIMNDNSFLFVIKTKIISKFCFLLKTALER